jgi:hypothetical protein
MNQADMITKSPYSNVTLVLPDAPAGLEKIRQGQRGLPVVAEWNGYMYMARNIASDATAAGENIRAGGEIFRCQISTDCTLAASWSTVLAVTTIVGQGVTAELPAASAGSHANNLAISMLQVNGNYLYFGLDNEIDGLRIYRTNTGVTVLDNGLTEITEQAVPGMGYAFQHIQSSTSLTKQGKAYLYLTVSDNAGTAIKVLTQIDQ